MYKDRRKGHIVGWRSSTTRPVSNLWRAARHEGLLKSAKFVLIYNRLCGTGQGRSLDVCWCRPHSWILQDVLNYREKPSSRLKTKQVMQMCVIHITFSTFKKFTPHLTFMFHKYINLGTRVPILRVFLNKIMFHQEASVETIKMIFSLIIIKTNK